MLTNRVWDEMERLFGPLGLTDFPQTSAPAGCPALNVWEDDDNLFVEAELPGLTREQIEITVAEGDQLTIAGERMTAAPEGCIWHRQECGYGRFSRTVTLPVVVDSDKVEAQFENGVLSLTLPKSEMARPKRIAVKTSDVPRALATSAG